MATGLEALGAASAVVQVIAFAGSLVSLSFKIYDGMPPNENELEEYSAKMMDAARRVQSRGTQVPQGTQVGDKLSKVSKECIDAATELRKETQRLTKWYQNSKGKMFIAVYSAFRADRHRAKLNQLDKSLKMCKEVMETELLLKICDQDTAIAQRQGQGFQSLEIDLQNLIIKIAEGYNRVEQLVSIEAQATRDAINTHLTSEFKALAIKNISDNQRQRLLKSLKSEEIRERYNAVLPSSDACFERVFAAYERVCRKDPAYKAWKTYKQEIDDGSDDASENPRFDENVDEIDHIWEGFSTWLQSDHKLFWIRGKPGSGKSTLIKFIINDGSTRDMLSSWNPRTRLLSHFFWKIGNEPQNSIKGLLCSLLYDLISDDKDAIDQVLAEFAFSQSKDFYKEWSSQEVEIVLHSLFRAGLHPICIFIDGLDEISNKDGFSVLLDTIQKFTTYQKVKVCVSSRPETKLVNRLESIGAQSLQLKNLTRPEMAVYVYQEFCKLPQDRRDVLPLREFTATLLAKAQGVFLWLALATKSVTSGIMNGDNKEILSQRLTELPDELESLYQTMWERLNGKSRVYRQTAARYFRFVIADGWKTGLRDKNRLFHFISEPNLAQLSLAIKVEDGLIFSPKANERKLSELNALCDATESDIQTRCAGMLQVGGQSGFTEDEEDLPKAIYPLTRPVQFIHRTAHDFLVDTKAGQSIVNYKSNETTSMDTGLKLLTCRLILAKTFYELGVVADCCDAIRDCNRLNNRGASPDAILEILKVTKDLYENGTLDDRGGPGHLHRSFPCIAAYHLTGFEDFIISCFMRTPSPELATNGLHELTLESSFSKWSPTSVRMIQRMIEFGGDAHVAKGSDLSFELPGYKMPARQHTTAFESLLYGALKPRLLLDRVVSRLTSYLDVIEILVQTCPDLHRRVILFRGQHGNLLPYQFSEVQLWVALEVDLQFLICWLLAVANSWNIPTGLSRTHELVASFSKPHVRIRHIGPYRKKDQLYCYRVLDQEPFLDIIHSFEAGKYFPETIGGFLEDMCGLTDGRFLSASRVPLKSFKRVSFAEEIDMLIQEGIGLYRD